MYRKIVRAIASASLLGVLIASGVSTGALCRGQHGELNGRRDPLRGIDVSHYQGTIDWPAVADDDVAFAYVKATEGMGGRDARFAHNWRGAREAGLRVGAYHYFIFCRSALAQAHNFLAVVPRRADSLPPAVDLEVGRSCGARLTGPKMRRELDAFLAVVEAHERKRAVLYVTPRFFATYRRNLPRRPIWRRSILLEPADARWTFWQYRSRARVAGIRGAVDLNLFAGGRRALDRIAG